MMNSKWFVAVAIMLSILLTYTRTLMAFDPHLHIKILAKSMLQNKVTLSNYITGYTGLKNIASPVNGVPIIALVQLATYDEDVKLAFPKFYVCSHFYNPLINKSFDGGTCDSYVSAYDWANDGRNDWSWANARKYFYEGLTLIDEVQREQALTKAFTALGHVVHLVQDMAVPAHTRSDIHIIYEPFESYTKSQMKKLNYSASSAPYNVDINITSSIQNAPRQLWDGDSYSYNFLPAGSNIGLSEYSAANFFSRTTVFATDKRPKVEDTNCNDLVPIGSVINNKGETDQKIYISKIFGERVDKLVAFGLLTNHVKTKMSASGYSGTTCGNPNYVLSLVGFDDDINQEYASKLVPLAVTYGAALMDYFFKSQIEITLPDDGVYAFVPDNGSIYPYPNMNFTQVTLKAKNILLSGEDMSGGDITLDVTYRIAQADPFVTGPVDVSNEISHAIVTKSGVTIPKGTPVELTFDLPNTLPSNKPIPILATDVYLQLAYKGMIGAKADEVAFGYKDISEPTPADFFNSMDKICLNNNWYDAGSQAALAAVDSNGNRIANFWDVYAHNAQNFYLRYSTLDNPINASSTEKIASVPLINAGEHKRVLYFLSDYEFNYSLRYSEASTAIEDGFRHFSKTYLFQGAGIKRQTDVVQSPICEDEKIICSSYEYPAFYDFRNVYMWNGSGAIFMNEEYPTNSDCPLSQLSPVLNPSTPATEQSQPQDGVTVGVPVYVEPRFITLQR
ncbi:MAG: hypothetical protein HQL02_11035 [Nitrospirae bacterium]|nr:hypothetical protein [Nitrospirota bacterium]